MLAHDSVQIFTPEDRAAGQAEREMQTAALTGQAAEYRWHLRKNGARFWADGVMMPTTVSSAS